MTMRILSRLLVVGITLLALAGARAADGTPSAAHDFAPVTIDGHTLFQVRGSTSYPAGARAATIRDRILGLARDPTYDPATLELADTEHYVRVGPVDRPVLRVTEADAELEGLEPSVLAEIYVTRIRDAIAAYRAARTREALISSAWRAVAATVVAAVAFFLFRFLRRALQRWLERRYRDRVKSVSIRSFELLRAERIWAVVRGVLQLLAVVVFIALTLSYLRYLLALVPQARGFASQIDDWVLSPLRTLGQGFVASLPKLVFLVVWFFVVRYGLRLLRHLLDAAGRSQVKFEGFEAEWAEPTYKILRIAVVAFAIVVAYPYIPGSSSLAFQGVSVFLGVMLSLGSSSAIANIIAGYTMVYRRAFREGDLIRVGQVLGFVTGVRLQVTHLRTAKNEEVVMPNASIMSSEVTNYSSLAKLHGLVLHTTVGIGYQTPWRQVQAMMLEAAARTPGVLKEPPPFMFAKALGDFAVTYEINAYCDDASQMLRSYSDLHRNILDVFNEYGVQIMTPNYESDPAEPKVVPRDRWHLPPAREP